MRGRGTRQGVAPQGTGFLGADLTEEELSLSPAVASIDTLLIDDLTDDEDNAFAAALGQ